MMPCGRTESTVVAPLDVTMTGKTAVVTGATGGIGKEIARGLARLGADVVIGARDPARGEAARADILASLGAGSDGAGGQSPGRVSAMPLDVADHASIRAFGAGFGERHQRLDVLVNNAGAWFTDRRVSPDGFELTFATNVLGPHLLTQVLLDRLRAAGRSRVLNIVSSMTGSYDATDLQFTRRPFDGVRVYSQSKQALCMLTWGLAERLDGSGVTVNAVAPGFVRTDFNRDVRGLKPSLIRLSSRLFAVSPVKGADSPLWAATAPELEAVTGRYISGRRVRDGKFREPEAIADLERRCREMEAQTARPRPIG
jgi:NAD(P)-dependent dehydrogenase (short-subunit alcohol dehydrogenase family)